MLDDGRYDAVVVDAQAGPDGELRLELAIAGGPHKGDVVSVRGHVPGRDELGVLGLPAVLTVRDGTPSVRVQG